ncbi:MAG: magnesium/cobalt transporter CorA [Planctomycetes bacterium]|nr:magnesium/cobalt transporter CorA [Planctomycetota bacterium]MCW8135498.1 magnesium/cobalt transporter CorA [Planctomycetota bacterium]
MSNTEIIRRQIAGDEAHRPPVGAPPGTLVADPNAHETRMLVIDYGPEHFEQREISECSDLKPYIEKQSVTWIDVTGFKNIELIRVLGEMLDIHPLALADAVNVPQRAKAEAYPDYVFIVTHAPELTADGYYSEQAGVLFSDHFVLTFQERRDEDIFKVLRDRIKASRGLVRRKGPGYLAYTIIDVITDSYFNVLDELENKLDAMEKRILKSELNVLEDLYGLRHQAMDLRRAIESHRDALSTLMHIQVPFMNDEVRLYMRDCLDHSLSQVAMANSLMDYVVSLRELLASEQAQRLNEVTKVLTMVATIFIPLSFFAGVYGMNFEGAGNMPELDTPYFYWFWWAAMLAMIVGMVWFFKRKGWIGK